MECYIEEGFVFVACKSELQNAFICWIKWTTERGVEEKINKQKEQKEQLMEQGPGRDENEKHLVFWFIIIKNINTEKGRKEIMAKSV